MTSVSGVLWVRTSPVALRIGLDSLLWFSRTSDLHISSGDKNKHRYVIATQSQPLRNHLRTIPAVPIIHIKKSVVILEPPSDTTLSIKAEVCLSLLELYLVF